MFKSGINKPGKRYNHYFLKAKIKGLKDSFPNSTIHTSAVKANPLVNILKKANAFGLGAEVASEGELFIAQKAGFDNKQIIFDSPAKTIAELTNALQNNIHINADSLMELDRIAQLKQTIHSDSIVGLRINPQVGTGKIAATSLAGEYSEFGIPVKNYQDKIIEYFKVHKWINGIHMHIGSQGCEMQLLLKGIDKGLQIIKEINKKLESKNRKVEFFDIGGGLSVAYHHNQNPLDIKVYGQEIQNLLKKYNLEDLKLIIEFGRYLHVNSGYVNQS
ncbi:MAG: hypothetical protein SVU94_13015 [Bacteroidota bacterium]|nr:hypothetical protein [Bacteroidota bacterium]